MQLTMDSWITLIFISLIFLAFASYGIKIFSGKRLAYSRSKEGLTNHSVLLFTTEALCWALLPVPNFCIRYKISPNTISLVSFGFAILGGITFAAKCFGLGAVFYLWSALLDLCDGHVARANQVASESGKLFDAVIDKYGEFAIFFGIAFAFRMSTVLTLITFLASFGALMVGYISAKGEMLKINFAWTIFRKPGRVFIVCIGGILTSFLYSINHTIYGFSPIIIVMIILALGTHFEAIKNFINLENILLNHK